MTAGPIGNRPVDNILVSRFRLSTLNTTSSSFFEPTSKGIFGLPPASKAGVLKEGETEITLVVEHELPGFETNPLIRGSLPPRAEIEDLSVSETTAS